MAALGLDLNLSHKLFVTEEGQPRSKWQVAALQTSLAPEDREHLRWSPPGGIPAVKFKTALIGRAFSYAGGKRWLIREKADANYEIRSPEGQVWVYRRGILTEIEHPLLGRIVVEARGALIQRMFYSDGVERKTLILASYDDLGRLIEIQFGRSERHAFTWATGGGLSNWSRQDETEMNFSYRNGLLERVVDGEKPAMQLVWRENPGWQRGDRSWPAPCHLASDGERDYHYDFSSAGFLIEVRQHAGVMLSRTHFNPRRRRLEQRAAGESLLILFNPKDAVSGGIGEVRNGRGELLESYRYDINGNLVSITRKGEPTLNMRYDESGRVMALDEETLP